MPEIKPEMRPAAWRARFWAWLIDILLVSIPWHMMMTSGVVGTFNTGSASLAGLAALTFAYWTLLEGYRGQSLGKMILNIMVVGTLGQEIGFMDAAVESFGKAFLLPLDFLAGMIASPRSGQRLFNRLSGTIVVDSRIDGIQ